MDILIVWIGEPSIGQVLDTVTNNITFGTIFLDLIWL